MKTLNQIDFPVICLQPDIKLFIPIQDASKISQLCTPYAIKKQCYQKLLFYASDGHIYALKNVQISKFKLYACGIFANIFFFVRPMKPKIKFDGYAKMGSFSLEEIKQIIVSTIRYDESCIECDEFIANIENAKDFNSVINLIANY